MSDGIYYVAKCILHSGNVKIGGYKTKTKKHAEKSRPNEVIQNIWSYICKNKYDT